MRGNRTHLVRKKHDPPEQSKDPAALTPRGLVSRLSPTTK